MSGPIMQTPKMPTEPVAGQGPVADPGPALVLPAPVPMPAAAPELQELMRQAYEIGWQSYQDRDDRRLRLEMVRSTTATSEIHHVNGTDMLILRVWLDAYMLLGDRTPPFPIPSRKD